MYVFPILFPSSHLTILLALFLILCYMWFSTCYSISVLQTLYLTALFVLQSCQKSYNPLVGHSFVFELMPPCLTVRKKRGQNKKGEKEMVDSFMLNLKKGCEGTEGAWRQNNWRKSHSLLPFRGLYKKDASTAKAAEYSCTSTAGSPQPSVSLKHRTWQQLTGSASGRGAKEHRTYVFCAHV